MYGQLAPRSGIYILANWLSQKDRSFGSENKNSISLIISFHFRHLFNLEILLSKFIAILP